MSDSPDEEKDICPQCEERFRSLGTHWSRSSECSYPLPTDEELAILDGLMLAGANLANRHRKGANPYLRIVHRSLDVLEWLADELGRAAWVAHIDTLDAEQASPDVYGDVADVDERLTVFRTRSNPHLGTLAEWYRDDERVVPERVLEARPPPLLRTVVGCKGRAASDRPRTHVTLSTTQPTDRAIHRLFDGYAPRINHGSSSFLVRFQNTAKLLADLGPWPSPLATRLSPAGTEPETVCPRCNGRFRKRTHICERIVDGEVVRIEDASTEIRQLERSNVEGLR